MELARNAVFTPCSALAVPPCSFLKPVVVGFGGGRRELVAAASLDKDGFGRGVGPSGRKKIGTANSNYVVPLDMPTPGLVRPLAEILRDLNSRVSEKIINPENNSIPWYHANRMLSFYAPGWCGEVRDVIFSDDGSVTVVYRVTIRGSDGELLAQAHRESTGTVSSRNNQFEDPVTAAEELAFCRACARFGFGLHLYHED
ncbi:hypothetical protein MA16_Dca017602 [Dendrobium catenatum]|uniref:DNA repair RAD52-like protein 2, chloroplastic n=1 Tax=Dendrobium catenatum TaxID=906689 RepID=A0A2I0WKK8_9ASPA|nr:hypothetical protein MA16_Dca017602 [Dendrobium catenatum]